VVPAVSVNKGITPVVSGRNLMTGLMGKIGMLPKWTKMAASFGAMTVVVAGLAVTAGIAGTSAIEVKDAVLIEQDTSAVYPASASKGLTTRSDGTKVNIGISTFAGDEVFAQMSLNNQSSNTTFDEELALTLPAGITAEITGGSNIVISLAGKDKYLVRVSPNAAGGTVSADPATGTPGSDELEIALDIGPSVAPGIQNVSFELNLQKDE
jgi:hypothetical protein